MLERAYSTLKNEVVELDIVQFLNGIQQKTDIWQRTDGNQLLSNRCEVQTLWKQLAVVHHISGK
jgi:hypothetical protein